MYKTTSILALGLFLSLAPQAFAQTQTDQQPQMQQDTSQPAETNTNQQDTTEPAEMDTTQQDTTAPAETDTTQQDSTQPTDMDAGQEASESGETVIEQQATDEPAATDTGQQATDQPATMDTDQQAAGQDAPEASEAVITGQITEQEEGSRLASNLMGAEVMSPDGESIGKISDLILSEDGQLQGVVVGVGGFLGIGEKRVAIGMGSIEMRPSADNPDQMEIVSDQTREQLEEATAFRTTADIRAEEEAAQAEREAQQAQPPAAPQPAPAD